jgi:hypothetical protein
MIFSIPKYRARIEKKSISKLNTLSRDDKALRFGISLDAVNS